MSKYFVTCARGLEEITEVELHALEIQQTSRVTGGVFFDGDQDALYRAHLWLRTGNRILLILRSFPVKDPEDLYENLMRFKWETFLTKGLTFAVDCTISGRTSPQLNHSHYARLKAKDAIVDRMRDKTGDRPDVDTDDPDISVVLYIRDGVCSLNVDATGPAPLHERGYRARNALAPLKETLAAGILKLSGWQPEQPLVDPMCGSGTLVAEAALIAANIAPGSLRARFSFMNWPDFHEPRWEKWLADAEGQRKLLPRGLMFASDHDPEAVRQTKQAFKILGLSEALQAEQKRFGEFQPPVVEKPGWIVMNPPYGDRLGEVEKLKPLYRAMGDIFKQRCQGWNGAVFTGSAELMKEIGLKTKRKIPLWNGPIECRLLTYEMYAGSARKELQPEPIAQEAVEELSEPEEPAELDESGQRKISEVEAAVLMPSIRTPHSLNKLEEDFESRFVASESVDTVADFAAFTLLEMMDAGLIELHPDFSGKNPLSRNEAEAALAEWAEDGFSSSRRLAVVATSLGKKAFQRLNQV